MQAPIKSAGIIIIRNKEALLVKHLQKSEHINNVFGIPSGRLNNGESEIDCAIRELKEETGLVTTKKDLIALPNHYVATIKRKTGEAKNFSMKVFKCKKFFGELKKNQEAIPMWIKLSKLDKLDLLPNTKNIIIKILGKNL